MMVRRIELFGLLIGVLVVVFRGRDWLTIPYRQLQMIRLNEALAGQGVTAFGLENGGARPPSIQFARADIFRQWGDFYAHQQPPDWAQALVFYEMALNGGTFNHADDLFQTRLQRARAWRGVGQINEAVAEWEALLRLRPHDYAVLLDLATTAWQYQNDFAAAEHYYQQAIGVNPDIIWAYRGLGLMYEQQGRHQEALHMFMEVLLRQPDEPIALEHANTLRHNTP